VTPCLKRGSTWAAGSACHAVKSTHAKSAVAGPWPMHKSNYMLLVDRADLLGINNKGGLHR